MRIYQSILLSDTFILLALNFAFLQGRKRTYDKCAQDPWYIIDEDRQVFQTVRSIDVATAIPVINSWNFERYLKVCVIYAFKQIAKFGIYKYN